MTDLQDRVARLLYPEDGRTTVDLKFFCGGDNNRNHSAEELLEMACVAVEQVLSGEARKVEDLTGY